VWRLDREERTPALEAQLEAWLAEDTRRRGAFLQAEATWAMLDRGRQLAGEFDVHEPRRQGFSKRLLLGAGAALAASVAGVAYLANPADRYDTALGEIRRVPLKDGSTVAINTQSDVEVTLRPDVRRVKLARGEAWFQVAKNADRPFVVEAGRVRVRAIGTAFSVRLQDGGAEVLVSEGVVEAWVAGAEGRRVRIAAGAGAYVAENVSISERATAPSEVDRQLAWRSGKIDLAGETLSEAAAEFNRYNERKLVVASPQLGNERLYGVFRTDDPKGFAAAVEKSLGASVSVDDRQITIGPGGS
jgi:transmembrane sensor